MADKKKVTIDAAWFAELWKKANEADKVCEDCVREKCGECKVVKERDVLKNAIARMEKSVEQMREKDLRELEAVRKERDELKAKLAGECKNCVSQEETKVLAESLAEARRCIEDSYAALTKWNYDGDDAAVRSMFDNALAIIREYREKR